jgi:hypothetical protein
VLAAMPFGASAQTARSVWISASGQASTSSYFYSSTGCSTASNAVTYMYRGGPGFRASGIAPTSGSVYEEFNGIGSSAWGKAYFFSAGTDKAFEFWFQGNLSCRSATVGTVSGSWTVGYAYSRDRVTGQLLCTKLAGRGNAVVSVDFQRKATSTTISGSYVARGTQVCS